MALPVSAVTFDTHKELVQCLASASVGSTFVVTVLVLRLFLGWNYVGSRLLSATVQYEVRPWGQVAAVEEGQQLLRSAGCLSWQADWQTPAAAIP